MSKEVASPIHPFEVRISIGANTREYIERALEELLEQLRFGSVSVMSGGWDGSYSMHTSKRDITPDDYRKELEEWRKVSK